MRRFATYLTGFLAFATVGLITCGICLASGLAPIPSELLSWAAGIVGAIEVNRVVRRCA